ncbi:MAG: hypothetical protein HQL68_02475, partial [Magnetococcales bacterium]|nr:hypothetical protein [Magnetococcales bacterium]
SNRAGGLALLGHLLTGDGQKVLSSTTTFYDDGTEPEALINDLLDMLHTGVKMQVVGNSQQKSINDEMAEQISQITQSSSQEHLQMAYQVLLRGSQDLRLAENQQQALEMLLLRVAYLKPVPDIGRLIKMAAKAGENSSANSSGTQATAGFTALPDSPVASPASHPNMGQKQVSNKEPVTSWLQLISLMKRVAPELAMKLEQQVACLDFYDANDDSPPRMVLQLVNDCFGPTSQVKDRIVAFLEKTGVSGDGVVVEPASEESRPETIGEKSARVKSEALTKLVEQTKDHPIVRELSARFQVEILNVEPLNEKSVQ